MVLENKRQQSQRRRHPLRKCWWWRLKCQFKRNLEDNNFETSLAAVYGRTWRNERNTSGGRRRCRRSFVIITRRPRRACGGHFCSCFFKKKFETRSGVGYYTTRSERERESASTSVTNRGSGTSLISNRMALFYSSSFKSQFCSDCVCVDALGQMEDLLIFLFSFFFSSFWIHWKLPRPTAGVTLRTREGSSSTCGVVRAALSPRYKSADGTHTRCCITIIIIKINENKISKEKYLSAVCDVKKKYLSTIRVFFFFISKC